MDRQEALTVLAYMIGRIGKGYHPDTPICDYVMTGASGYTVPSFSRIEAEYLQGRHDKMVEVLGDELYSSAIIMMDSI